MKDTKKIALVTGIFGQDGSYMAEYLLGLGYEVHGISREKHQGKLAESIESLTTIHYGDIKDQMFVDRVLEQTVFDEIYNFAAISDLGTANKNPEETKKINHDAVGFIFNKAIEVNPKVRLFQASSSQMFDTSVSPQNEDTQFVPRNVYAETKIDAHNDFVVGLRKRGVFVCSGFLFNHESPRREDRFVTGKIAKTMTKIKLGLIDTPLELGNMDMERDWGFAGDFVRAAHLMLQAKEPKDYVVATGKLHTVREFVEEGARCLGLNISWKSEGIDEYGVDDSGKVIVKVNKDFYAPKETFKMVGDISKIKQDLGWEPSVSFESLVSMMIKNNLEELSVEN
ncbi:MAG: GDP-mannose 4,6-dehydratase [Parcubacteria bacterium C7867-005]|nr:MAG: GDP-mannose 4,6-dehydratase [Parcubacteria bacterium C7867-005]